MTDDIPSQQDRQTNATTRRSEVDASMQPCLQIMGFRPTSLPQVSGI